jgi:hypothetical protein
VGHSDRFSLGFRSNLGLGLGFRLGIRCRTEHNVWKNLFSATQIHSRTTQTHIIHRHIGPQVSTTVSGVCHRNWDARYKRHTTGIRGVWYIGTY